MKGQYDAAVFDGSDESLARAVSQYNKPLIFFINSFMRNIQDAEDVVADTFLELLMRKPSFREEASFKTYLFTCARNNAIDRIRKSAKKKTISADELQESADTLSVSPEDSAVLSERDQKLRRTVAALPEEYREVIILLYFEGMSCDEAAQVLRKSKKQMYNLSHRARQAIKEALEKDGFDYEN